MNWGLVDLGDFAVNRGGSVDPSKTPQQTFELYSIPSFDHGKPEIVSGCEIGSSKKIVQPGDVLLSRIVPHIRRAWVVEHKKKFDQIASGEWIIFRSKKVNQDYLKRWLTSDPFHVQFMSTVAGVGGSLLRARPEYVYQIKIPLPPLEEQKRIAAILDKADAIRRKRQKAIDLADQFLRSVFLDMFGDPVTKGWKSTTVENLAEKEKGSIRTGPFGSQLLHSEFTEEGVAVLGIDNAVDNTFKWAKPRFISDEKYRELSRYRVKPRDVIITIMGTCGRCAVVPEDVPKAINTKHLCCITPDQNVCSSEFLHAYFLMHPNARKYLNRQAKGAIMDGLNMGIIKELPVVLPPIKLQQKFANLAKQIKKTRKNLVTNNGQVNSFFSSLAQRAFKGELTQSV